MPLSEYRGPLRKKLMGAAAYDVLREAIISGELQPGELIKDSELATRLGLSRTPVREALVRLAEAGLVESKPGVHTKVAALDRSQVIATLDVLQALHGLAVRSGVPRLTDEDLQAMRRSNEQFAGAVEHLDVNAALTADDQFHSVLIEASANPVLARLIAQLHPMIDRILYRKFSTLLGGRDTIEHHAHLIDLCARGDAETAAERSGTHWARLGGTIEELFDSHDLAD